jgi:phage tail-like protein
MADDGSTQSKNVWPLPKFSFMVKIGSDEIAFQEVSGHKTEAQVIEYRAGDSRAFSTVKMPSLKKFGNITMNKGVFRGDSVFFNWFEEVKMNVVARKLITISLLDEKAGVTMVWSVVNAFPVKITGTNLNPEGNVVCPA